MYLLRSLRALLWFLWQGVMVGGLGVIWFVIPFALLLVFMTIGWRRSSSAIKGKAWVLLSLPALWIFVGLWGGWFWVDWQRTPFVPNPAWVLWPVDYTVLVFLALSIALITYFRSGRLFASMFVLANSYFMLVVSLMAKMAVTGNWL